ncbi:ISAs1 family transposase [Lactococcus hodotermopsidis]|uniref:ISAs1 family transposase n=2 Tax=Pseudolactococcus hodotermopsidis TaxID=2709157 RepID=A0A6A0BG56_9LACT|nr:ISAs1 family transposase [Lactococcus hodotermopsidis]GFH43484.1 ISAs1 family transposase [Lactococcus hodotermopsidis]
MTIKEKFTVIEDLRDQSYVAYPLCDVLIIVMCGVLCGLDQLCDIVTYAENKAVFLKKTFNIEKIPSKATFSRILNMVDSEKIGEVIFEIMRENFEAIGDIIAVDGKAIRSTSQKGKPHSALQILSAYLTESGITLGQRSIHEKTNEIPVFQEMLEMLDVKGKTITADALHCQKKTCEKIIQKGGDYVFGLKENQGNLYDDVKLFIESENCQEDIETFSTLEKSHGRFEKRECYLVKDITWLVEGEKWAGITCVFAVKRTIETKHKTTQETCFYISSLETSPENLLTIVREHWKIESLHWMLDVVFSEDACQLKSDNAQKVLDVFRKLGILAHRTYLKKKNKKKSVKQNLLQCLLNERVLCAVIGNL